MLDQVILYYIHVNLCKTSESISEARKETKRVQKFGKKLLNRNFFAIFKAEFVKATLNCYKTGVCIYCLASAHSIDRLVN
jgi:hypothetical protein